MQAEPDHQEIGQGEPAAVGGLADREPLGEVVQADPRRDRHAHTHGLLLQGRVRLGHRHRARAEAPLHRRRSLPPEPAHVQEPEQADPDPGRVDGAQAGHATPVRGPHRPLQRSRRVLEDVEEQEHEDPRGEAVQEGLGGPCLGPDPAHRKPEEDGQPGDGAEEDGLPGGHCA